MTNGPQKRPLNFCGKIVSNGLFDNSEPTYIVICTIGTEINELVVVKSIHSKLDTHFVGVAVVQMGIEEGIHYGNGGGAKHATPSITKMLSSLQ